MVEDRAEVPLLIAFVDLTRFFLQSQRVSDLVLADTLDAFYECVAAHVEKSGGRVVKFMGDACFAVFPEDRTVDAVDAVLALEREASGPRGLGLSLGANVHLAIVAEGELGPDDDRRYDVIGSGVNHLFRMGGGSGVRISEPVYRSLPDERRGRWDKVKPPATYVYKA